jgi:hypothetical protein
MSWAARFPDLTLIFDMPAEVGLERALARGGEARFESKGLEFHQRLGEAFLEIARREPERCVVIEADDAIDAVWADVWTRCPRGWASRAWTRLRPSSRRVRHRRRRAAELPSSTPWIAAGCTTPGC